MSFRILPLFLGMAAASAALAGCVPDQAVDTQTYTSPDGVEFTITTSTCKPGTQLEAREVTNAVYDPLSAGIFERDASECTDPAICQCGFTCQFFVCFQSSTGPVQPSDCTNLTNAILSTLKGTFFVGGGLTKTANSGSCEYSFVNEGSTELEYCWDDLANLGHATSLICPAQDVGCQGGAAALNVLFSSN